MPSKMNMDWWRVACSLWLLLLPLWCSAKTSELLIHTSTGVHSFKVTTATSQYEQLNGLHGWTSLAINEGMLFVFPEPTQRPFWMKHISIPLDILFVDSNGKILDIVRHAEPGSETPLIAGKPFLAALEVNADTVSRIGIVKGDHVYHPLIDEQKNTRVQRLSKHVELANTEKMAPPRRFERPTYRFIPL